MLDVVVVGVDGSPAGRAALRWAARHTRRDIHLVHAISPVLELVEAVFQIDTTIQTERARASLGGEWILDTGLPRDRVCSHVIEDNAPRALIDTARRYDAGAIVIGANGRDRIGGLVGSNAGKLIHLSDVPMIVVPIDATDHDDSQDRIVVALGGNADSDARLIDWARRFADGRHGLELVYSVSPHGAAKTVAGAGLKSELDAGVTAHMRELLGDTEADDHTTVSADDPLTAIIEASKSAPLAVIGSHHSRRVGGFLTGAIAQHLPAINPCPVAIIPLTDEG